MSEFENKVIELLEEISSKLDDISGYSSAAASQASFVDSNTSNIEKQLKQVLEKLDIPLD